ncbi:MAG: 6-carboxytetrahydropterin synthase QueD [bacterium]
MSLTKKFTFDAAHRLSNYAGKCKNLHGHTYLLEVTIKGRVNKRTGMVMDFEDIKKIVDKLVLKKLDHQYINKIVKVSTAENIIQWIWKVLSNGFKKYNVELYILKLWETPNSCVTYKLFDYEN